MLLKISTVKQNRVITEFSYHAILLDSRKKDSSKTTDNYSAPSANSIR